MIAELYDSTDVLLLLLFVSGLYALKMLEMAFLLGHEGRQHVREVVSLRLQKIQGLQVCAIPTVLQALLRVVVVVVLAATFFQLPQPFFVVA